MKAGLYPRLAWQGMCKNRRLYLPYLLSGSVMVMMYELLSSLIDSPTLLSMAGGSVLSYILPLGCVVIAVFSFLFLLYTHGFLIRQRSSEFGLYHVLGMDKKHLARILCWETALCAVCTLVCGITLGIVFSKFAELILLRILRMPTGYDMHIRLLPVQQTAQLYAGIYLLLLLFSLWRILRMNTLRLLHSDRMGEKPPRANWAAALAGVVLLAAAYGIALYTRDANSALALFFVAVLLVVAATYLLFISGSVALCRALQRNRRYYYKASHFISVSSMVYRMRRTGAGLASICILATMVLVILSSTGSLFLGAEDALHSRYPYDLQVVDYPQSFDPEVIGAIRAAVEPVEKQNLTEYRLAEVIGYFGKRGLVTDQDSLNVPLESAALSGRVGYLQIIPLEDYNRAMDASETLSEGECLLHSPLSDLEQLDAFDIAGAVELRVKKALNRFPVVDGSSIVSVFPVVSLVTDDFDTLLGKLSHLHAKGEREALSRRYLLGFDVTLPAEEVMALHANLNATLKQIGSANGSRVDCREAQRRGFYDLYGSLLFLGLMLSAAFLMAAVIIVYYKQLSEGYEDQARFSIMQKVGMTRAAIRKSVNSQMLTVFFLPLGAAGLHLCFAFPMLWQLLKAFGLGNLPFLIGVTACCYGAFFLFYVLVYKLTANAYYRIVSA